MPPPRYRVVEKDRRLIVIDRWAAGGASATPAASERPARAFRRTRFDGRGVLTTRRWFDDHGPRTLTLGADAATTLWRLRLATVIAAIVLLAAIVWQPLLAAVIVLGSTPMLMNDEVRAPMRRRVTAWLDRLAP